MRRICDGAATVLKQAFLGNKLPMVWKLHPRASHIHQWADRINTCPLCKRRRLILSSIFNFQERVPRIMQPPRLPLMARAGLKSYFQPTALCFFLGKTVHYSFVYYTCITHTHTHTHTQRKQTHTHKHTRAHTLYSSLYSVIHSLPFSESSSSF